MRRRFLCWFVAGALAAQAATVRLYLKDGGYHSVREYQKLGDRVKYFSTERGEWEEIPLALVDLKKTEEEVQRRDAERKVEAETIDAEEKAERAQQREIEQIPMNPGVYFVADGKVSEVKQAEAKVVNNKRRSILKRLSPLPVVSGQSNVELEGLRSATVIPGDRPEFYMRLADEERFAIAKLRPLKTTRWVQKWDKLPVVDEIVETTDIVETFKQQLSEGLYKIWPTQRLEAGEYAVVEYTEGKGNIQIWDFSLPGGGPPGTTKLAVQPGQEGPKKEKEKPRPIR